MEFEDFDKPGSIAEIPLTIYFWAQSTAAIRCWNKTLRGKEVTFCGKKIQFGIINAIGRDLFTEMDNEEHCSKIIEQLFSGQCTALFPIYPGPNLHLPPKLLKRALKMPENGQIVTTSGPNYHNYVGIKTSKEEFGPYYGLINNFWSDPSNFIYKSSIIFGEGYDHIKPSSLLRQLIYSVTPENKCPEFN